MGWGWGRGVQGILWKVLDGAVGNLRQVPRRGSGIGYIAAPVGVAASSVRVRAGQEQCAHRAAVGRAALQLAEALDAAES